MSYKCVTPSGTDLNKIGKTVLSNKISEVITFNEAIQQHFTAPDGFVSQTDTRYQTKRLCFKRGFCGCYEIIGFLKVTRRAKS